MSARLRNTQPARAGIAYSGQGLSLGGHLHGFANPEAYMRVRILSLTDWVYRLQAK